MVLYSIVPTVRLKYFSFRKFEDKLLFISVNFEVRIAGKV